jgi:hypothetical protein
MNLKTQINNFTNGFSKLIKETNMATKIKSKNKSNQPKEVNQPATAGERLTDAELKLINFANQIDYSEVKEHLLEEASNLGLTQPLSERIAKFSNKLEEINVKNKMEKTELAYEALAMYCAIQEIKLDAAKNYLELFKQSPEWEYEYGLSPLVDIEMLDQEKLEGDARLCANFIWRCEREIEDDWRNRKRLAEISYQINTKDSNDAQ